MTDNALFALIRSTILAGLSARGLNGWDVARSFAPSQQGANSTPTVYVFKTADHRHGSPQQWDGWDAVAQAMTHYTSQQYETTFQASALVAETTDPSALTPSDALALVADIIQTDDGLAALAAQGVGILRVADVRNPYNVNDYGQFAAGPSFDFVLTYRRTYQSATPVATSIDGSFNRV